MPPPALTVRICTVPTEPAPGRITSSEIDLPPSCVVVVSTRGPAWNWPGLTVIDELGLRLIPKVAAATSRASGITSPVVCTPARPPRFAANESENPPATEMVLAGVSPVSVIT